MKCKVGMAYKCYLIPAILCFIPAIAESACDCIIPNGQIVLCRGAYLLYRCDEGYAETADLGLLRCYNGNWTNGLSSVVVGGVFCALKLCPNQIPNGELSPSCSRTIGSRCNYTCNTGYNRGPELISCEPSTNWSTNPHVLCTSYFQCPYELGNGEFDLSCRRLSGDVCGYSCRAGYAPSQQRTVSCDSNLKWNRPLDSLCKEILCSKRIPNGEVSDSCLDSRSYNDFCFDFNCNVGYVQDRDFQMLRCNSTGDWSVSVVDWQIVHIQPCLVIKCPPIIPDGYITSSCSRNYGSYCDHYTCIRSVLSWKPRLRCNAAGQWEWVDSKNPPCSNRLINNEVKNTTGKEGLCPFRIENGWTYGCDRKLLSYCEFSCNGGCFKQDVGVVAGRLQCFKKSGEMYWSDSSTACFCPSGGSGVVLKVQLGLGLTGAGIVIVAVTLIVCTMRRRKWRREGRARERTTSQPDIQQTSVQQPPAQSIHLTITHDARKATTSPRRNVSPQNRHVALQRPANERTTCTLSQPQLTLQRETAFSTNRQEPSAYSTISVRSSRNNATTDGPPGCSTRSQVPHRYSAIARRPQPTVRRQTALNGNTQGHSAYSAITEGGPLGCHAGAQAPPRYSTIAEGPPSYRTSAEEPPVYSTIAQEHPTYSSEARDPPPYSRIVQTPPTDSPPAYETLTANPTEFTI